MSKNDGKTAKQGGKHAGQPLVGEFQLKHAGGRPTSYDPSFCDKVIELGKLGYSKAMIGAEIGVVRKTLDNWAEENPEFLHAMQTAREFALAWWDAQGQQGIWAGKQFNSQAFSLQVRNRFPDDYKEKQVNEHTGPDGGPVQVQIVI